MKTLTLRLTDEMHKELKVLSASTGIAMSDLLMKAVQIITKQKGIEETTFAEAFEKSLSSAEWKERSGAIPENSSMNLPGKIVSDADSLAIVS